MTFTWCTGDAHILYTCWPACTTSITTLSASEDYQRQDGCPRQG